jgi:hypothetical protein
MLRWPSGRPAIVLFEACSAFHSRYGLHTRAVTVYRDTLTRGFSHFVTSIAAPVASGWNVAGWDLHLLESAAFSRRMPKADITPVPGQTELGRASGTTRWLAGCLR